MAELARLYAVGVLATIALGLAGFAAALRWRDPVREAAERCARPALALTCVFYAVSNLAMGLLKAAALNYYADRATHLEILWRATHGFGLTSLMSANYHHGAHWFAAHFTPIVYVAVVPFFALWPRDATLTVLQTAYLTSAAIPIYLEARDRLGASSAAWLAAAFLLYPTLGYINLYGIEYLELSIPALAWALRFFRQTRWLAFAFAIGATLAVREELGLVVFAFGLYALYAGRRAVGGVLATVGLVWTLVVLRWIIPSFRSEPGLVFLGNYQSWGRAPGEILAFLAAHPFETMRRMMTLPRAGNMVMFLLPLGFLPLLTPAELVIALPNVVTTFMSDAISNYNFTLYYLSPTLPVLFFAAIESLRRVRTGRLVPPPASAAALLFVTSLSCNHFFGGSPLSRQFWDAGYRVGIFYTTNYHRSQYRATDAARAARRLASSVPADAQISAEQHLLPLLFDRRRILVFPALDPGIDYVMIDRAKREKSGWVDTFIAFRENPERFYAGIERGGWKLVAEEGGARLFRRTGR